MFDTTWHAVNMPPTFVWHIPINLEWAETLVGLRLNVPNSWWPGFFDGGINQGWIVTINFENVFYFKVELNDKLRAHYAMRYDSVLLYIGWSVVWLAGRLVSLLVRWLVGWSNGWLVINCSVRCLVGWLVEWSVNRWWLVGQSWW